MGPLPEPHGKVVELLVEVVQEPHGLDEAPSDHCISDIGNKKAVLWSLHWRLGVHPKIEGLKGKWNPEGIAAPAPTNELGSSRLPATIYRPG